MKSNAIERARAKLNLTMDVLEVQADGYHSVKTVMQTVEFADTVRYIPGDLGIRAQSNLPWLPTDVKNLAVRAAELFARAAGIKIGGLIMIDKQIPVGGGMAGGSSNAAAVLRLLNREYNVGFTSKELEKLSEKLGSDVPFCVCGGTVLAEGRGEKLTELRPVPSCSVVICRPDFFVSTPELFTAIDSLKITAHPDTAGMLEAIEKGDINAIARRVFNVFEAALPGRQAKAVSIVKSMMLDMGASASSMTGTGSAVFGLFSDTDEAARAVTIFIKEGYSAWLTRTSPRQEL